MCVEKSNDVQCFILDKNKRSVFTFCGAEIIKFHPSFTNVFDFYQLQSVYAWKLNFLNSGSCGVTFYTITSVGYLCDIYVIDLLQNI